jgi:WD40 repeat protein/serine/threonine protein kinase
VEKKMTQDDATQYKPTAAATTYYQQIEEKPLEELEAQVSTDWQVGDVILDLYEVKEIITSGGMGLVYRVHHRGWNLDLAVKSPRPEIIASEKGKQDFIREAKTWVNLGLHPHIASCYYVRTLGGGPRIFAEYCEGGSLEDWIQSGRLYEVGKEAALERILDIAIQFAWGLGFAHDKGLVHQDVKPHNVLMTTDGTAKVTDFGLAKAGAVGTGFKPDLDASILVSSGGMTPAYCSPEQAEGKPLSNRTDIWSWGLSVLEMFTGEVTWRAGQAAAAALESYFETGSMNMQTPMMPGEVAELLGLCFKQDPGARPERMKEIASRLQQIFNIYVGFPYPRSESEDVGLRAVELNNRAVSLLDIGMEDEAHQAWSEALSLDPQHLESTYNLGLLQWRRVEITDEALLQRMREVSQSRAGEWLPSYLIAQVHLERGDCEGAIHQLEELTEEEQGRLEIVQTLDQARQMLPLSRHCLRTFEGHTGRVNSVSFSPDGRFAISVGGFRDETLRLWNIETGECLRTFEGHSDSVLSVSFSPDGCFALSGSQDTTLQLWDIELGKCLSTFWGHESAVSSVTFSPDGLFALSGSWDGTLRLWNVATGQCLRNFEGSGRVSSVAFSPDGRFAISGGKTLRLWGVDVAPSLNLTVKTGQRLRTFNGHTLGVSSVAFSSDGLFALSGSDDKTLRLWDIETGECLRTFEGHSDSVSSVSFSPDGHFALSGSVDETVRLWDVETGECLRTFEGHSDSVFSVSFSSDGRFAISGSGDNTLRLWEVAMHYSHTALFVVCRGTLTQQILIDQELLFAEVEKAKRAIIEGQYHNAVFHLHSARSLQVFEYSKEAMQLWQQLCMHQPRRTLTAVFPVKYSFNGHTSLVTSVSFSSDGLFALSGSVDETVRLWDIKIGECLRTFEGHSDSVSSVSFSPDGRFAISGSWDTTLRLWDIETGECLRTFEGHTTGSVNSVSFSPDGRFAISGSGDSTLRLWNISASLNASIETSQCLLIFEGHTGSVNSVRFSPDGRFAISGSGDRTLRLWNISASLNTGAEMCECLRTFEGHTDKVHSVSFSPDGRYAISGSSDKTLRLWDVKTGECLRTLEGHTDIVHSVSFSPDGRFALFGSHDKTLRMWDISASLNTGSMTGECLRTFEGHTGAVLSVSFSPDGRFAISGSLDQTMRLWSFDWDLEEKEPADWDEGARPYLQTFLYLHVPYAEKITNGSKSTPKEIAPSLAHRGKPRWIEENFKQLLYTLGCAGYGWLRPEGVRKELIQMTREWQGPPPLRVK